MGPSQEKKKDGAPAGDVEGASAEELNQKITTLEKEKNKEEEYRNYMQLERVSETACKRRAARSGSFVMAVTRLPTLATRLHGVPTGQNQCFLGDYQEGAR